MHSSEQVAQKPVWQECLTVEFTFCINPSLILSSRAEVCSHIICNITIIANVVFIKFFQKSFNFRTCSIPMSSSAAPLCVSCAN